MIPSSPALAHAPLSGMRRQRAIDGAAWAVVLLMVVVVLVSACLRLSQPRPVCDTWPACRGVASETASPAAAETQPAPAKNDVARTVHRAAASMSLLLVIALVCLSLLPRPRERRVGRLALYLLALALGLAALGIVTPGSRSPLVLLGNLLGGYAMLALAWRITRRHHYLEATSARELERRARVASTLWIPQVICGALSGTGQSAAALIHLGLALPCFLWVLMLGVYARRVGLRAEGAALLLLVIAQPLLGGTAAWLGAPAQAVALHNLSAALSLALLMGLRGRSRSP